jgi:hypothetical protein
MRKEESMSKMPATFDPKNTIEQDSNPQAGSRTNHIGGNRHHKARYEGGKHERITDHRSRRHYCRYPGRCHITAPKNKRMVRKYRPINAVSGSVKSKQEKDIEVVKSLDCCVEEEKLRMKGAMTEHGALAEKKEVMRWKIHGCMLNWIEPQRRTGDHRMPESLRAF